MISQRQVKILEFYLVHQNTFVSAKSLSVKLDVSPQTIKNDIRDLNNLSHQVRLFKVISAPNKGTKITVFNSQKLNLKIKEWEQNLEINNKEQRSNLIINYLLSSYGYVTKSQLMRKFYIRETTLYKQTKNIKKILSKFNLSLKYKTNCGYLINGSELNKRNYLSHLGVDYKNKKHKFEPEEATKIYNIAADIFFNHKYHINEEILQNITAHIYIALQRIKHNHFVEESINSNLIKTEEYQISEEILTRVFKNCRISQKHFTNETLLLTQIILGKLNYINDEALHEKMNNFLNTAFDDIYAKFAINLDAVDNLRVLLILHLIPLFYRVQSGTQLPNPLENKIHTSFPQAYDIALYFSQLLEKECHLKISKNELSFLVLYFNYGIENYLSSESGKKILIITSLRKSETILLKHKILNWFPKQIAEIRFAYPTEYNEKILVEEYDAIFSTENNISNNQGEITYINLFPSENDYKKIKLALNGFDNIHSILEKFDPSCFYYGEIKTKKEALDLAIENATSHYHLTGDFAKSVKNRETLNSTYFGNKIAIPHTAEPVSNDTFVSVVALKNEIKWDSYNTINLILLVSIAKNNPKEFQFWYYISSLIQNPELLKDFRRKPTFISFKTAIKKALKNKFI